MRSVAALLLFVGCVGCRTSTTPSDMDDSSPMSDAVGPGVIMSGRTNTEIPADVVRQGKELTVSYPGHLTLKTTDRRQAIWLWPDDTELPIGFTRHMVYKNDESRRLLRRAERVRKISVRMTEPFRARADLMNGARRAAQALTNAGSVVYELDAPGADSVIEVSLNPDDPVFEKPNIAAFADLNYNRYGVITGCRVVVKNPDWHELSFVSLIAHELGHCHGFSHLDPDGEPGIMNGDGRGYRYLDFTEQEKLVFVMHSRRLAGTRLSGTTEDERHGAALRVDEPGTWHRVCELQ